MIFFVRYVDGRAAETASAESGEAAKRLEGKGYTRCHSAVWDAARAELDAETIERMGGPPRERAVGEPLLKTKWAI